MDNLRKRHNDVKRTLLKAYISPRSTVLDVGCGRGGDFRKYHPNTSVYAIDPSEEYTREAISRNPPSNILVQQPGDVFSFTGKNLDAVVFNFSLQYTAPKLQETVAHVKSLLRPGGLFLGVMPLGEDIERKLPYKDSLGNTIVADIPGHICVQLMGGPFYAGGPQVEPLLIGSRLIAELGDDFEVLEFDNIWPTVTGTITDLYVKFVFQKKSVI